MLKEAIEKIVSMAAPATFEIDGCTFASERLVETKPEVITPQPIQLSSLDALVQMVKTEAIEIMEPNEYPIYITASEHDNVTCFTRNVYGDYMRAYLYKATCRDIPGFKECTMPYEQAMIALRSKFQDSEGTKYLIGLLCRITEENSITEEDNGISQSVQVHKGVTLVGRESVKPIVALRPYRTFQEIEQPESEFLIRIRDGRQISFIEADGGMWKLQARMTIKKYFEEAFASEIEAGVVVVTI